VLLHGLLGVRTILLDFGLPARWQRLLFLLALLAGAATFAIFWRWRWY
jgi:succinate dehydrogenase hydrophobic anchor subunit